MSSRKDEKTSGARIRGSQDLIQRLLSQASSNLQKDISKNEMPEDKRSVNVSMQDILNHNYEMQETQGIKQDGSTQFSAAELLEPDKASYAYPKVFETGVKDPEPEGIQPEKTSFVPQGDAQEDRRQVESVAAALTGTVDCPPSVYNTNQATEDEPGTGFVETFSGGSTAGSTRGSIRAAGSATGYTKEFGGEITSIKSTGNQELREQNEGISQEVTEQASAAGSTTARASTVNPARGSAKASAELVRATAGSVTDSNGSVGPSAGSVRASAGSVGASAGSARASVESARASVFGSTTGSTRASVGEPLRASAAASTTGSARASAAESARASAAESARASAAEFIRPSAAESVRPPSAESARASVAESARPSAAASAIPSAAESARASEAESARASEAESARASEAESTRASAAETATGTVRASAGSERAESAAGSRRGSSLLSQTGSNQAICRGCSGLITESRRGMTSYCEKCSHASETSEMDFDPTHGSNGTRGGSTVTSTRGSVMGSTRDERLLSYADQSLNPKRKRAGPEGDQPLGPIPPPPNNEDPYSPILAGYLPADWFKNLTSLDDCACKSPLFNAIYKLANVIMQKQNDILATESQKNEIVKENEKLKSELQNWSQATSFFEESQIKLESEMHKVEVQRDDARKKLQAQAMLMDTFREHLKAKQTEISSEYVAKSDLETELEFTKREVVTRDVQIESLHEKNLALERQRTLEANKKSQAQAKIAELEAEIITMEQRFSSQNTVAEAVLAQKKAESSARAAGQSLLALQQEYQRLLMHKQGDSNDVSDLVIQIERLSRKNEELEKEYGNLQCEANGQLSELHADKNKVNAELQKLVRERTLIDSTIGDLKASNGLLRHEREKSKSDLNVIRNQLEHEREDRKNEKIRGTYMIQKLNDTLRDLKQKYLELERKGGNEVLLKEMFEKKTKQLANLQTASDQKLTEFAASMQGATENLHSQIEVLKAALLRKAEELQRLKYEHGDTIELEPIGITFEKGEDGTIKVIEKPGLSKEGELKQIVNDMINQLQKVKDDNERLKDLLRQSEDKCDCLQNCYRENMRLEGQIQNYRDVVQEMLNLSKEVAVSTQQMGFHQPGHSSPSSFQAEKQSVKATMKGASITNMKGASVTSRSGARSGATSGATSGAASGLASRQSSHSTMEEEYIVDEKLDDVDQAMASAMAARDQQLRFKLSNKLQTMGLTLDDPTISDQLLEYTDQSVDFVAELQTVFNRAKELADLAEEYRLQVDVLEKKYAKTMNELDHYKELERTLIEQGVLTSDYLQKMKANVIETLEPEPNDIVDMDRFLEEQQDMLRGKLEKESSSREDLVKALRDQFIDEAKELHDELEILRQKLIEKEKELHEKGFGRSGYLDKDGKWQDDGPPPADAVGFREPDGAWRKSAPPPGTTGFIDGTGQWRDEVPDPNIAGFVDNEGVFRQASFQNNGLGTNDPQMGVATDAGGISSGVSWQPEAGADVIVGTQDPTLGAATDGRGTSGSNSDAKRSGIPSQAQITEAEHSQGRASAQSLIRQQGYESSARGTGQGLIEQQGYESSARGPGQGSIEQQDYESSARGTVQGSIGQQGHESYGPGQGSIEQKGYESSAHGPGQGSIGQQGRESSAHGTVQGSIGHQGYESPDRNSGLFEADARISGPSGMPSQAGITEEEYSQGRASVQGSIGQQDNKFSAHDTETIIALESEMREKSGHVSFSGPALETRLSPESLAASDAIAGSMYEILEETGGSAQETMQGSKHGSVGLTQSGIQESIPGTLARSLPDDGTVPDQTSKMKSKEEIEIESKIEAAHKLEDLASQKEQEQIKEAKTAARWSAEVLKKHTRGAYKCFISYFNSLGGVLPDCNEQCEPPRPADDFFPGIGGIPANNATSTNRNYAPRHHRTRRDARRTSVTREATRDWSRKRNAERLLRFGDKKKVTVFDVNRNNKLENHCSKMSREQSRDSRPSSPIRQKKSSGRTSPLGKKRLRRPSSAASSSVDFD